MAKVSSTITNFKSKATLDYAYIRTDNPEYIKDCLVEIIDPKHAVVLIHDVTAIYPDMLVELQPQVLTKINIKFQYDKEKIVNHSALQMQSLRLRHKCLSYS